MTLPSLLLWMMASSTVTTKREFRFVPYGAQAPAVDNRPTVSCDGRVEGVSLELTHWTNNETPDYLYADTSTEMALKFASLSKGEYFEDAVILNNHYDSDGVLSVWACLNPEIAPHYSVLLKAGAEAGDFGEWNSDEGVKLGLVIESFLVGDEEDAYKNVLQELPSILQDLETTGGESYRDLWQEGFERAQQDWETIRNKEASFERGPGKMVLLYEPQHFLSPYAVDHGLKDCGLCKDTTRILRVLSCEEESFKYRYGMPGHGWVKKLVDRPVIPSVDKNELVKKLPANEWAPSGGLTGICHTSHPLAKSPNEIASLLHKFDEGCQ